MIGKTIDSLSGYGLNHPIYFIAYFFALSAILFLLITEIQRSQARIPGFTGPTGLPMIGNLWDIRTNAAEQYRKWSKKYSPVYQIMLGNVPVIVVNSAASARV